MKDHKNPYGKYNGNEADYALRFLDSENPDNGKFPWVQEFEKKFCELSGAKYAISVTLQQQVYIRHCQHVESKKVMRLYNQL